ncbi:hypothetical protein [Actinoplanes awajinensis]|uniref:Uncharacterized protein n=1 Tax=Actinoplanes awajinensis subsp. mycoplanecinus TaxID=135947 RepID=A0A117MS14_9ACTN|nr:hypothetical protein [Actinoplanes awajinensis]KUL32677.1 hypothetical protein ADL15_19370 [Actinoplanes awajinensis subsp. mycoplanecinus]
MVTAAAPVWLLDVDGVLNANRPGWSAAPRRGMAYAGGTGFLMRWAPARLGRTLLIAPAPNRGLQPEHLTTIEAFVAAPPT